MSEDIDKAARTKMAAHVGDIASHKLRSGDTDGGALALHMADEVLRSAHPVKAYREALAWSMGLLSGDDSEEIDAAVAAALRGEHPPGSLPQLVADMAIEVPFSGKLRHEGKVGTCKRVLGFLGCAPAPTTEPR